MGYFSTVFSFWPLILYIIFISFGYEYVYGTHTLAGVYYSFYLLLANSFASHNHLNPHARPIYACFHFIAYIRLRWMSAIQHIESAKERKKRRVSKKIEQKSCNRVWMHLKIMRWKKRNVVIVCGFMRVSISTIHSKFRSSQQNVQPCVSFYHSPINFGASVTLPFSKKM